MLVFDHGLGLSDGEVCPEITPKLDPIMRAHSSSLNQWRRLGGYIFYRFTPVRRMRSKHPTLPVALGLNPSLTVDLSGARPCGSTKIGKA